MEDPFTDRLSDYLDGTLDTTERGELAKHLEDCLECQSAAADLRALRRMTRSLARPEPPEAVWGSVVRGIGAGRSTSGGVPSSGWPSYLTSGLALAAALVLGIGLWLVTRVGGTDPNDSQVLVSRVTEELRAAETHYENAIEGLEQIIAQNEGVLPEELNEVLSANLDLIENAIVESREAMRTEPNSTVAQESLLEALRRKVSLLRSTILLINEVRKGEGENAMDLIDRIRKTEDPSNPI